MHIVHFATKYGTIQEAMNKTDGLAVLGVLFQVNICVVTIIYTRYINALVPILLLK